MNGDKLSPFSDKQVQLVHPILPLVVRLLRLEDHATQMQCALAEYMNLML